MPDPLLALARRFEPAIAALTGGAEPPVDPALRRSDRADAQANCAMTLAKRLGKPPREIAQALVDKLDVKDIVEKLEIAGPGFINVWLKGDALAAWLRETAHDPSLGIGAADPREPITVDYSSPNVAKEMHVGHVRSTVIGDAIARVLEARGHMVIRQNHLGDWGTPFGMLIEHLVDLGRADEANLEIADLDAFYREARAKFDASTEFADRARKRVVSLQAGDASTLAMWKRLVDASTRHFEALYIKMRVKLSQKDTAGESLYNAMLADVVKELQDKGLAVESDGALCVFPPGFKGKDGAPLPLIVRKQDGGYGYATTDLAAVRYRTQTLHATRLIYVVGAPQSQHFQMVFTAAKLAGWLVPPARAEHVAFGSVLGPDKKMFRTRSGDAVKLASLVDEAIERAAKVVAEKNPELDEATRDEVARAIGVGAIKYADLSSDRIKDYIFDWDRMLAFEGNSAPYVMYAHARIRSIFRKAGEAADFSNIQVVAPAEHALALDLLAFGAAVADVERTLEPHKLCSYLFALATSFSTFFEQCPVLRASSDAEKKSRLALCELTAKILARGLDLLGISAPDRM